MATIRTQPDHDIRIRRADQQEDRVAMPFVLYTSAMAAHGKTVKLWRPVGREDLALIRASAFRRFRRGSNPGGRRRLPR